MSNPFDSAQPSNEKRATTDQEIAPAAEIRAYLARHGGPSPAVTSILAEPTPAATAASSVSAESEPIVVEPPAVAVEDTATEVPISVDAEPATTPVQIEPVGPAVAESANTSSSEPEPAISEPEQVTPAPEPIAVEPTAVAAEPADAAVASTVSEPPVSEPTVSEIAPTATIAPPQSTVSPPPANGNSIDVVPERVTDTGRAREAPARSGGQRMQARSNIPLYLLALTTVLALGAVAYQTYLLRQSMNIIDRASQRMDRVQQQNEYVRACRDLSDAYFLVKQRVAPLMAVPDRSNIAGAARISEINRLEAQDAVTRFTALGAFLGNAQDGAARERYGELSRVLTRLAEDAKGMPLTEFDKAFEPADKLFTQVNSDCARVSQFPKT